MKLGLTGLPKSGKTTLFNAVTKSEAPVSAYATGKTEPNMATVKVEDERIKKLSDLYTPKKTTFATVEFVDFVGVMRDETRGETFSSDMLRLMKTVDALALVIRNFESELEGEPQPLDDLSAISEELILSDLIITEKRLERIEASFKKGQKTDALVVEQRVLQKILEQLNATAPIREMDLDEDELAAIRGFQFLSAKPAIAVLNSDESRFGKSDSVLAEMAKSYRSIEFAGSFEMELSRLEESEAREFMADIGITESARDRLIALAYDTLGYISFFTVGEDEVRAWNITRGDTAVEAAGAIHSDLARGFIAAECFPYHDLIELGSEKAVKDKGKFRLEGKTYVVNDGDILSIRFNV